VREKEGENECQREEKMRKGVNVSVCVCLRVFCGCGCVRRRYFYGLRVSIVCEGVCVWARDREVKKKERGEK
jgi:hypothetical protein